MSHLDHLIEVAAIASVAYGAAVEARDRAIAAVTETSSALKVARDHVMAEMNSLMVDREVAVRNRLARQPASSHD